MSRKTNAREIAGIVFQWAVYLTLAALLTFTVMQMQQAGFTL